MYKHYVYIYYIIMYEFFDFLYTKEILWINTAILY